MSTSSASSDANTIERLVADLRAGDAAAADKLWAAYGGQLRRRARTRLRQYGIHRHAESMDICNAVLLDLVKQGQVDLRQPDDVVGYFMRAVDNQVRDAFRALTRECRDMRRTDLRPVEDHRIGAEQDTPSRQLFRKEILAQLRQQLGPCQVMVELVVAGESWQEIGQRLQMAPDTARMRWRRALRKVQADLGIEGIEL